jgi:N utilization substance protein A
VKNIVRELNNEKVDIIKWDANAKTYIANALSPAQLKALELDEVRKRVKITVAEDQLSLAIGKRGQNARLTSKLTGWQIDIEPEAIVHVGFDEQVAHAVEALAAVPGLTREQADVLVHHGLLSLEAVAELEVGDIESMEQIKDQAGTILEAARAELARRKTEPSGGTETLAPA